MNIENIASLSEKVQSLGFINISSSLLKRICFKPASFIICQRIDKGKDQLRFHLFFERESGQSSYDLMYYDAILQKAMALSDTTINGIDISALERRMAEIDWKIAFELDAKKQWNAEDKSTWEKELRIESIVTDLIALEASEEGKSITVGFKIKHWAGVPYQELFGNISPLKNKSEISQRFYFFEEKAGISVDDAYRFLQNKCLEKEMQEKKKQTEGSLPRESESDNQASPGSGLLKKKRQGNTKGVKTNKAVRN
jgi:hypothetical protein